MSARGRCSSYFASASLSSRPVVTPFFGVRSGSAVGRPSATQKRTNASKPSISSTWVTTTRVSTGFFASDDTSVSFPRSVSAVVSMLSGSCFASLLPSTATTTSGSRRRAMGPMSFVSASRHARDVPSDAFPDSSRVSSFEPK